jgi:hypothetical protein
MSIEPENPRAAVDDLYAALDPLASPARMRALATWTQDRVHTGGGTTGLRPLLYELDTRGPHGRRLAVVSTAIAGDVGFLEVRLADPDAAVRGHALKASLRLPISDAALERAMDDAPEAVRRQLATVVVAGGRTALAERLLVSVRELWGDEEAARLLPGCGTEAVERLLPGLFLAVARWRVFGRRYPDLVLDEAARQLAELPEQSRGPWWHRNAVASTPNAPPWPPVPPGRRAVLSRLRRISAVVLIGTKPPVWRRPTVPSDVTLGSFAVGTTAGVWCNVLRCDTMES